MTDRVRVGVAVGLLVAVSAMLTACTHRGPEDPGPSVAATPSRPSAEPTPNSVDGTAEGSTIGAAAGQAPLVMTLSTSSSSVSVRVTVRCSGEGPWTASLANADDHRHGTCGDDTSALIPLPAPGAAVTVSVQAFTGGATFSATATETPERFEEDPDLATACRSFATPRAQLLDADAALTAGTISSDDWRAEVTAAQAALAAIELPQSLHDVQAQVEEVRQEVGAALPGKATTAAFAGMEQVSFACDDNSTPIGGLMGAPGQG